MKKTKDTVGQGNGSRHQERLPEIEGEMRRANLLETIQRKRRTQLLKIIEEKQKRYQSPQ
ncbi:hypothetical protein L3V31_11505 [Vibrio sp. J1-1]|uniref:hypothetical protein n=1 Tax=Vibrio sp. J1-1 TaxID=2912251 RepID=UPI001F1E8239|nr:hypothetical protein [Vibrio sp. J1-1]MBR9873732.1 hypothetical protein [Vibrionaceae bacterium]MCF7482355.1 hypothetical protein [Vibrio sp. J1-1]